MVLNIKNQKQKMQKKQRCGNFNEQSATSQSAVLT